MGALSHRGTVNVKILCAMREQREKWWATDQTLGNPSECTGGNGQRERRTRETMFKKVERVKSLK